MRAVTDLARPPLEPARERDGDRIGSTGWPTKRLGRLPRAAEHDPAARHERHERVVRQDDYRVVSMDNSELLRRDLLDRVAENVGVLEPDVGQQHDAGAQHVRRVVAPAEPGLDDGDVDLGGGERSQRRGRDRLELRRAAPPPPSGRMRAARSRDRLACPSIRMRSAHERT